MRNTKKRLTLKESAALNLSSKYKVMLRLVFKNYILKMSSLRFLFTSMFCTSALTVCGPTTVSTT